MQRVVTLDHCGMQVPVSPFDNALAVDQMEVAYSSLLAREVPNNDLAVRPQAVSAFAKDGREHPRIITSVLVPSSLSSYPPTRPILIGLVVTTQLYCQSSGH